MRSRDAELREIEGRLTQVCGMLNVAHAKLVDVTRELIRSEVWRGEGIRSVEHWLTLKTGLSPERARQVFEVASKAAELPATTQALAAGELSFEQAHAVSRHTGKFLDTEAASFAKIATVPQIRRTLSRYTFTAPSSAADASAGSAADAPDPGAPVADGSTGSAQAAAAAAPGRLSMRYDGDRFVLRVNAPADAGALIEAALGEAKDALFDAGQPSVTGFDALSEVCNRSMQAVSANRRDHYRVLVHLDTGGGWLNAGPALPVSLMAKLTCEGTIARRCGKRPVHQSTWAATHGSSPTAPAA